MNAGGNVRCSVAILGEHDLTHQTARAMIERINSVTRAHASALAPRKGNQSVEVMRICRAQCRHICLAGFVRINEISTTLADFFGSFVAIFYGSVGMLAGEAG
jgi:hypothetical protein